MAYEEGTGRISAKVTHEQGVKRRRAARANVRFTNEDQADSVEIVALGPATNVAKAMQQDPEIMKKVKRIWAMGSAGLGPGNATPVAEFNVYHDAEAFREMLDFGVPVTVVGLDVCDGEALWTGEQFAALEKTGEVGEFVTKSFGKIREFYEKNGSGDTVMNCDPVTIMCLAIPGFMQETIPVHGSCITDAGEAYA